MNAPTFPSAGRPSPSGRRTPPRQGLEHQWDDPAAPPAGLEASISRLGLVFALGLLAAALGLGYWTMLRAPALLARADNPRRIETERRVRRGDIVDRRGRALAQSEEAPPAPSEWRSPPQSRGGGQMGQIWVRTYPAPEAAPVVGFYSINLGTGGIEDAYDAAIRGQGSGSALERIENDLFHRHPTGVTVTLTLDRELQSAAGEALGDRAGGVVLLDVENGDVLAMASAPTYDPNTLDADWPDLVRAPNTPMLNRAAQGLYPPGAIFQTITLAAAIEEGLAEPTTVFTDPTGVILTVDPPISCPTEPLARRYTLAEAYTWPCNVEFARLGLAMGGERLADYATRLGVGRPLDLPIGASIGQLLERGIWSDLLAGRTAMGRGEVLVTPLEMALATATLANDGLRPVPRLVLAVGEESVPPPGEPQRALSEGTAQRVREVLADAYRLAGRGQPGTPLPSPGVAGRAAAGWAGMAESGRPGAPPHAWFIGYAPVETPRYAVAVIVEYGEDGWGAAAPIGIELLEQTLRVFQQTL
jgi:peptidoglycan glycosyltransferase